MEKIHHFPRKGWFFSSRVTIPAKQPQMMPSAGGSVYIFPPSGWEGLLMEHGAAALGGLCPQTLTEFKLESSTEPADGACKDRHQESLGTSTPLLSPCLGSRHPSVCRHNNLEVGLVWDLFDSRGTFYIQGDQTVTSSYFSIEPFVSRCSQSFWVI